MHAPKVVPRVPERNSSPVVLPLFAGGIGETVRRLKGCDLLKVGFTKRRPHPRYRVHIPIPVREGLLVNG